MFQFTEQQRIAAYQRGWIDAQRGREPQHDQPIMYQVGYTEASKSVPNRFTLHEVQ